MNNYLPTVENITVISTSRTWETKSGGVLSVLFKLPFDQLQQFLTYDHDELSALSQDIRGLRSYSVSNLPIWSVGANEWHKLRNEIVFCTKGVIEWSCRDVRGNTVSYILNGPRAIITPHHLLHTYRALEDDSAITVVTNTLYDPDNTSTHDTYTAAEFDKLGHDL